MHCSKSLLTILVTTQNVAIMWKQGFSEIILRAKAPQKTCTLLGLNTCIPTIPVLITVALCLCLQFCPYSVYKKQTRTLLICFFVQVESHYPVTTDANTTFQVSTPNVRWEGRRVSKPPQYSSIVPPGLSSNLCQQFFM